jgi:hypothetical protein
MTKKEIISKDKTTLEEYVILKGTLLAKTCIDQDLCNIFADGNGSTYFEVVEKNAKVCILNAQNPIVNIQQAIDDLKKSLAETDYKMTVDYFNKMSKEQQDEIINSREKLRQLINEYRKQLPNQISMSSTEESQNFIDAGGGQKIFVCPREI